MSESKLPERFSTPNSSKLAQILLDLRGVDGAQSGLCNLQPSDITLWPEMFGGQMIEDKASTSATGLAQDTCNCRKSRCLKLYCQCFAARATCSSTCRCVSCENKPDNAAVREVAVNLILERNPNAFDSKYRPTSAALTNNFTAITSIAHKNGCRCRKSMCLKKYCECFQGGVPCSAICTCLTCQNTAPHTSVLGSYQTIALSEGADGTSSNNDPKLASQTQANFSNSSDSMMSGKAEVTEEAAPGNDRMIQSSSSSSGCRPPLAPSMKRKRESLGTDGINGWQGMVTDSEQATEGSSVASPVPQLPAAQSLTRTQQQQLLEQLLYQELESQGLLSSPFASFVNINCPGLLQGQGHSCGSQLDIFSLFNNQQSRTTGPSTDAAQAQPDPLVAQKQESKSMGHSLLAASPNSMNIATALALLAANAQAQAQARSIGHLPYSVPNSSSSVGVAGLSSALVTPRDKFSVHSLTAADASGCEADVNSLHYFNGNSPLTTQHTNSSQHDCTDEETTCTRTGSRSEISRSDSIGEVCPERKDLFGAQGGAETPANPDAYINKDKCFTADCASSAAIEGKSALSQGFTNENSSPNRIGQVKGLSLLR